MASGVYQAGCAGRTPSALVSSATCTCKDSAWPCSRTGHAGVAEPLRGLADVLEGAIALRAGQRPCAGRPGPCGGAIRRTAWARSQAWVGTRPGRCVPDPARRAAARIRPTPRWAATTRAWPATSNAAGPTPRPPRAGQSYAGESILPRGTIVNLAHPGRRRKRFAGDLSL